MVTKTEVITTKRYRAEISAREIRERFNLPESCEIFAELGGKKLYIDEDPLVVTWQETKTCQGGAL